ncbi:MAG: hypothetical protein HQL26_08860 [Candidatus Omnitrophica bacterium]|nr:hypothetical protein [Candidatus Omnitrophota bacterium]
MNRFIIFLAGVAAFYLFVQLAWFFHRRKNNPAPVDNKNIKTLFQVRQYLIAGRKELAIKTYCEIFKVNHDAAQKDVEELERSITKK